MAFSYNAPNGTASTIDAGTSSSQMNTFYWLKKAIIDSAREQYFTQLADTFTMPKNFGKTIKCYQYVPFMDDRNVYDQGIDASGATISNGNLYGSSKDIGTITSKLPTISENGGRVNRVGFARYMREGTMQDFGVFYEWTEDAMQFDSDSELKQHLATELVHGASEMQEDMLQIDLLNNAGTVVYPGTAAKTSDITAEGANASIIDYDTIMRLDAVLTDLRTPMQTKVISGSRMIDTRVLPSCRVAYVGPELSVELRKLRDPFGNPAFIEVQHYASATKPLTGEIGSIGHFRIIEVPEMQHWAGVGAAVGTNPGYRATKGKYDVFPFLVVGDDSFTTIGFQTDGKSAKFSIITKEPGRETADRSDPYGKKGFSSLQFWYGFLCKRPERLGLIKCVAPV